MMVQDLLNTCMPRQLRRRATTLVRNVRICVCIQQMLHHAVCTEEHRMAQSGGADLSRVLETRHCLPALSSCKDIAATQPLDHVEDATRSAWLVDVCLLFDQQIQLVQAVRVATRCAGKGCQRSHACATCRQIHLCTQPDELSRDSHGSLAVACSSQGRLKERRRPQVHICPMLHQHLDRRGRVAESQDRDLQEAVCGVGICLKLK